MPANTSPIFPLTPNVNSVLVTAANTSSAGGGTIATDIFKAFTAGSNGSFVSKVRWSPVATATTTTTATVGRVFISSVTSGATTSSNTWMVAELTLPAVSADSSSAAANNYETVLNVPLPAGYTILVTNYASPAANTNWRATVFGADY